MVKAKRKGCVPFVTGLLAVLVMLVPYAILGEDAVVTYHDQLDGELLAYIFQAKYLFHDTIIAEFMGGMDKTALTLPAPMCVLLFCTGHYFAAYVCMQALGCIAGYVGMYLLSKELTENSFIAMVVGVMFAYLPFRPVYGLSQYGIPLLIWCLYRLWQGEKTLWCYFCIALFALNSSLVLVGFAVLGVLAFVIVLSWLADSRKGTNGRKDTGHNRGTMRLIAGLATMFVIYILENLALLKQILGSASGWNSHKVEYGIGAEPMIEHWLSAMWEGGQHGEDYHYLILVLAVPVFVVWWRFWKAKRAKTDRIIKASAIAIGCVAVLCLVSALWNGTPGLWLREKISALRGFQLERVLWLTPALWYLVLAGLLQVVWEACLELTDNAKNHKKANVFSQISGVLLAFMSVGCVGITGVLILWDSNLKANAMTILNPEYQMISYSDYYAEDVLAQVKDYLQETTGQTPDQYRVVSLGIDPAAAYYSGFYCLDGYSNNYALEYKHAFRKVLEPELLESDYLREYYDGWGNRCYLYSSEAPGYYTFAKHTSYFWNYKIDSKALAELGGKYIISALYLVDSELQGLRLMREVPFETADSYYAIYLYEVMQE